MGYFPGFAPSVTAAVTETGKFFSSIESGTAALQEQWCRRLVISAAGLMLHEARLIVVGCD